MRSRLRFRRKKTTLVFTLHPSPFTFSPETPINTGDSRGEGWRCPFTTLHHPSPSNGYKCKTLIYSGINTEPQSRKSIHPIKR